MSKSISFTTLCMICLGYSSVEGFKLIMSSDIPPSITIRRADIDRSSFLKGLMVGSTAAAIVLGGRVGDALAVPPEEAPDLSSILVTKEDKVYRFGDLLGKKATLLVNVASFCALTPQYAPLVDLHEKYADKGFQILAFPCNQFGYQEPDPIDKIRKDVKARFGANFPIFDKIDVNGGSAHPLYAALKKYEPELSGYPPKISWNFEKFIIAPDGRPLRRYRPGVEPEYLEPDIIAMIEKGTLPPARKRSLNEY